MNGTSNAPTPNEIERRLCNFLANLEDWGWLVHIEASANGIIRVTLRSPPAVDLYIPLEQI